MPPKSKPNASHRENKRAFDSVIRHMRKSGRPWMAPSHAVNLSAGGKGGSPNPAKPTMVEFWADIFLAIAAAIPKDIDLVKYHLAYTLYDSEDDIECELHAQELLGNRRHSVEQRLGAEFIKRGIFPVQSRGYFYCPRRAR